VFGVEEERLIKNYNRNDYFGGEKYMEEKY
jgi:hypothetical protein